MSVAKTKPRVIKAQAWVEVEITINDPDVLERVLGPGGDDWRARAYDLHAEADVIRHFTSNAIRGGWSQVRKLDGWADCDLDAARFEITDVELDGYEDGTQ